ncbi:MAG: hypothetical protein EZS28_052418, partial [Streblomastix strix]
MIRTWKQNKDKESKNRKQGKSEYDDEYEDIEVENSQELDKEEFIDEDQSNDPVSTQRRFIQRNPKDKDAHIESSKNLNQSPALKQNILSQQSSLPQTSIQSPSQSSSKLQVIAYSKLSEEIINVQNERGTKNKLEIIEGEGSKEEGDSKTEDKEFIEDQEVSITHATPSSQQKKKEEDKGGLNTNVITAEEEQKLLERFSKEEHGEIDNYGAEEEQIKDETVENVGINEQEKVIDVKKADEEKQEEKVGEQNEEQNKDKQIEEVKDEAVVKKEEKAE